MSLKKQFLTALYKFNSYPELISVKGYKTIIYTLLMVILGTFVMFMPFLATYKAVGGVSGIAQKAVPDYSIVDGVLTTKKIDFDDPDYGTKIYIDTSKNEADMEQFTTGNYRSVFVSGAKEICTYNGVNAVKLYYSDLIDYLGEGFASKAALVETLKAPVYKIAIISGVIVFLFIFSGLNAVYNIAMLTLIGNIINMLIVRVPLKFSSMLKLSAYARTLPYLLSLLIPLLMHISFNAFVFYAVGTFYMYKALKNNKLQPDLVIAEVPKKHINNNELN